MSEFADPARGILGVLAAFRDCRLRYPLDGQLRATGPICISSRTFPSVRTEWVAQRTMACFRGAYAGFLASNDLGAERALWIRLYSKRTTSRNLPQLRRKPAGRPCRTGFSLSCLLHHTLPSPNAIAKPPASGPPTTPSRARGTNGTSSSTTAATAGSARRTASSR